MLFGVMRSCFSPKCELQQNNLTREKTEEVLISKRKRNKMINEMLFVTNIILFIEIILRKEGLI